MKTLADGCRAVPRARRAPGWLSLLFIPAAALTLPNCFLERGGIVSPLVEYTTEASIRNADGEVFLVTGADAMFAGGMAALREFVEREGVTDHSDVQREWLLYLSRRFSEGAASSDFRAHFGRPPYCLVADSAMVRPTSDVFTGERTFEEESWGEPPACPTGVDTGCGNAPGVVPSLGLTPPAVLDFGPVPLGMSAGRRPVTVSNAGPGRLCLDAPRLSALSSHPGDFPLDVGDCTPRSPEELALGTAILSTADRPSCTMLVDFRPGEPGARSAQVLVSSNDPARPNASLDLAGMGQPGVLTVGPNPLCFNVPREPIGGRFCHRRMLDFRNDGPGVVTVQPVTIPAGAGNWTVQYPPGVTPPFTVPAPGTVSLTLLDCEPFLMESAIVPINSNAATPMIDVTLLGPGTGCVPGTD